MCPSLLTADNTALSSYRTFMFSQYLISFKQCNYYYNHFFTGHNTHCKVLSFVTFPLLRKSYWFIHRQLTPTSRPRSQRNLKKKDLKSTLGWVVRKCRPVGKSWCLSGVGLCIEFSFKVNRPKEKFYLGEKEVFAGSAPIASRYTLIGQVFVDLICHETSPVWVRLSWRGRACVQWWPVVRFWARPCPRHRRSQTSTAEPPVTLPVLLHSVTDQVRIKYSPCAVWYLWSGNGGFFKKVSGLFSWGTK